MHEKDTNRSGRFIFFVRLLLIAIFDRNKRPDLKKRSIVKNSICGNF